MGIGAGDRVGIRVTSGTAGTPKGVAVTHRNAAAFVDAEASLFLLADPLDPGTGSWPACRWPVWRLLGVRIGRRVFDDGRAPS
jgi:non-ribosomal peptide synthetase component F